MAEKPAKNDVMEKIVSLAKRRGFVFPTAEKYGGLQGFWDWGPLGVELKNNIKREWWKRFVQERADVVGLDSAIITNPTVWKNSGHLRGFSDPLVDCINCKSRFRGDQLIEEETGRPYKQFVDDYLLTWFQDIFKRADENLRKKKIELINLEIENKNLEKQLLERGVDPGSIPTKKIPHQAMHFEHQGWLSFDAEIAAFKIAAGSDIGFIKHYLKYSATKCPKCGKTQTFTQARQFNLMFKTFVGPVEDEAAVAYLRPETAQNIFVNYETVVQTSRVKVPFGIAQIGKAFRNEITPGNFIFRSREFEQMELEFFIPPSEDGKWFQYWVEESEKWFIDHGMKKDHLRMHEQKKDELAHYAKATTDIEYRWPFEKGWGELIGVANRTDFDLKAHGMTNEVPYVIEPSFGVERAALAFLLDAFDEVKGGRTTTTESTKEAEVVLRLHKTLAPIKIAVLPLSKKEPLAKIANDIAAVLRRRWAVDFDEVASIGRRYRRQDEIGTPYCVTIDFDTLNDQKVTVRDRDTMQQERVAVADLGTYFQQQFPD